MPLQHSGKNVLSKKAKLCRNEAQTEQSVARLVEGWHSNFWSECCKVVLYRFQRASSFAGWPVGQVSGRGAERQPWPHTPLVNDPLLGDPYHSFALGVGNEVRMLTGHICPRCHQMFDFYSTVSWINPPPTLRIWTSESERVCNSPLLKYTAISWSPLACKNWDEFTVSHIPVRPLTQNNSITHEIRGINLLQRERARNFPSLLDFYASCSSWRQRSPARKGSSNSRYCVMTTNNFK